jgi:hypothetical protein
MESYRDFGFKEFFLLVGGWHILFIVSELMKIVK